MKPDFIDVTYLTAFPGTPLFDKLEKEGRVDRNWNNLRLKTPSIKFKHYTHGEILLARKEIVDAFFTLPNITRILIRSLFNMEGSTLRMFLKIRMFLKMVARDKTAEKTRFTRDTRELHNIKKQH